MEFIPFLLWTESELFVLLIAGRGFAVKQSSQRLRVGELRYVHTAHGHSVAGGEWAGGEVDGGGRECWTEWWL